jgi:hypothetical protein
MPLFVASLTFSATCAQATIGTVRVVSTTADSGDGSLRSAILASNLAGGVDVIGFHSSLAGSTISPLTPLPALVDGATTINGDLNSDGIPDIALSGGKQASGDGLQVDNHPDGLGCKIVGLAIYDFPRHGILINGSHRNIVQRCHIGANLAGNTLRHNGGSDIYIDGGNDNLIGGGTLADRNVLAGGNGAVSATAGVYIKNGQNNLVQRNHIGVKRGGAAALGLGREGVLIQGGSGNIVGGSDWTTRPVFGGLKTAVSIYFGATQCKVQGCYIGTTADGKTALPFEYGVILGAAATNNTIGGGSAGLRNIFGGGEAALGVYCLNDGCQNNTIAGNYFGLTPDGLSLLPINDGVYVGTLAGKQIIGGSTAARGNRFCCPDRGVMVRFDGAGSIIRNNVFGRFGNGTNAPGMGNAKYIEIDDANATVTQNRLYGGSVGLVTRNSAAPVVTLNTFSACTWGVYIYAPSWPKLGNLANAGTDDDGGNTFGAGMTWFIDNHSANLIRAEGNDFGTTSKSAINAKIRDKADNAAFGWVDFDPLAGGISPTGDGVAVTGACAAPTAAGAEIVYTLTGPAAVSVEVLNLAGRPVAQLVADRSSEPGLQRLAWTGLSAQGLPVPAGRYLVRITARDPSGNQASAVASLQLRR